MKIVKTIKKQRGFSLLEVLLTVVLLSIGFLVAAKMQIQGLRSSQSSQLHAKALLLSSEIMDKMHNNPIGVENGNYDDKTTSTAIAVACGATGCTPTQLASKDLFEWSSHFVDARGVGDDYIPTLPGASSTAPATGKISAPVNDVYTISVSWQGFTAGQSVSESLSVKFVP